MGDYSKPLNNRYDPYVAKGKLDDYISNYLKSSKNLPQNFRYSNMKLALGSLATLFTVVAHAYEYVYDAHFPKDYWVVFVCVVSYFVLNGVYQIVDYLVEGDIFYTCKPNNSKYSHIGEFSFSSVIPKFSEYYQLTVYIKLKQPVQLSGDWKKTKDLSGFIYQEESIGAFFTEEGKMIYGNVTQFVEKAWEFMLKGK